MCVTHFTNVMLTTIAPVPSTYCEIKRLKLDLHTWRIRHTPTTAGQQPKSHELHFHRTLFDTQDTTSTQLMYTPGMLMLSPSFRSHYPSLMSLSMSYLQTPFLFFLTVSFAELVRRLSHCHSLTTSEFAHPSRDIQFIDSSGEK
jgi:hypothetical protein